MELCCKPSGTIYIANSPENERKAIKRRWWVSTFDFWCNYNMKQADSSLLTLDAKIYICLCCAASSQCWPTKASHNCHHRQNESYGQSDQRITRRWSLVVIGFGFHPFIPANVFAKRCHHRTLFYGS